MDNSNSNHYFNWVKPNLKLNYALISHFTTSSVIIHKEKVKSRNNGSFF